MTERLLTEVAALLTEAADRARTDPTRALLLAGRDRLSAPLRVALAGRVKAGKSTLLNALIGADVASSDAGECTLIPTWYAWSAQPTVTLVDAAGQRSAGRFRPDPAVAVDLAGRTDVVGIEIGWPAESLRTMTFVDTPGLASLSTEVSARTVSALTPDGPQAAAVDAVIYLLRHSHATDVDFLNAFGADDLARSGPANTIGVLSRADELGSGRLDAMQVAERIADRYTREPRLHRICPVVVPVNGLLAAGAPQLTGADTRAVADIAAASPDDRAALLLTADRFVAGVTPIVLDPAVRARLIQRIGLFGVRLAVDLLRSGLARSALRTELARRSGVERLRGVLARQFADRAAVLQARSALGLLTAVLEADGCADAGRLRSEQERIIAGAHTFAEIRMLDAIQAGEIRLTTDQLAELERLLGGAGQEPTTRLGVSAATPAPWVRDAAVLALSRWRRIAEHPLLARSGRTAAAVAQRTLEGML